MTVKGSHGACQKPHELLGRSGCLFIPCWLSTQPGSPYKVGTIGHQHSPPASPPRLPPRSPLTVLGPLLGPLPCKGQAQSSPFPLHSYNSASLCPALESDFSWFRVSPQNSARTSGAGTSREGRGAGGWINHQWPVIRSATPKWWGVHRNPYSTGFAEQLEVLGGSCVEGVRGALPTHLSHTWPRASLPSRCSWVVALTVNWSPHK